MKRSFSLFVILMVVAAYIFASDVSDLLDKAKSAYLSGDITATIKNIDEAKKILEKDKLESSSDEFIEVTNWDIVDLKSDFYIGKKVKMYGTYWGLSTKDTINIEFRSCTFDSSLVDQILTLEKLKKYTFFGTIKTKTYGSPFLHVEAIQ